MEQDYILIAVDQHKKFAIRFLSLQHTAKASLNLHQPDPSFAEHYLDFLLSSSILGSRQDDQESILFKMQIDDIPLTINCEVNSHGHMRSAFIPAKNKKEELTNLKGVLKIARLNKGDEVYESLVTLNGNVQDSFRKYLHESVQTESVFYLNSDTNNLNKNYALWIEKLPNTSLTEWTSFIKDFNDEFFQNSFSDTDDPDVIVNKLFSEPILILAVTKPRLTCSCSKDRILQALELLSHEDLTEIFMQGQGVETQCEYCEKTWQITDEELTKIMKMKNTLQ